MDAPWRVVEAVANVVALVLVLANHVLLRDERKRRVSPHHPTRNRG